MKALLISAITLLNLCQETIALDNGSAEDKIRETEPRVSASLNNSAAGDAYSWLSADGLRIYYNRDGMLNVIWKAERPSPGSAFGDPSPIPVQGLAEGVEIFSSWFSRDEKTVFFVTHERQGEFSTTLYSARLSMDGKSYQDPLRIDLNSNAPGGDGDIFISGPSLTPNFEELFVYYSDNSGTDRIAWYLQSGETQYTFKSFVNNGTDYCPGSLADHGLSFYLTRRNDRNTLVKLVRPSLSIPFGEPQDIIIDSPDSSGLNYYQPMVSPEVGLLSITAGRGSWASNDIRIFTIGGTEDQDLAKNSQHNDLKTDEEKTVTSDPINAGNDEEVPSVKTRATENSRLTVWPNPASATATIELNGLLLNDSGVESILEITELTGRILRKVRIIPGSDNITLDVTGLANGIYVCRMRGMDPVRLIVRH